MVSDYHLLMTLTLDEDDLKGLAHQAEKHHVSVQEWVMMLLRNAAERPENPESWLIANDRRLELIRKEFGGGLSKAEATELEALQQEAANFCEPADNRRRDYLDQISQTEDAE